jgi:hypothetical protein
MNPTPFPTVKKVPAEVVPCQFPPALLDGLDRDARAVLERPPRQSPPVLNLTLDGLDRDARAALERALVAASKAGRFMISVFRLEPEEGNPMLVLKSETVRSGSFPVQEFNLCQEHFHQHLADLSVQVAPKDSPVPEGEAVGQV